MNNYKNQSIDRPINNRLKIDHRKKMPNKLNDLYFPWIICYRIEIDFTSSKFKAEKRANEISTKRLLNNNGTQISLLLYGFHFDSKNVSTVLPCFFHFASFLVQFNNQPICSCISLHANPPTLSNKLAKMNPNWFFSMEKKTSKKRIEFSLTKLIWFRLLWPFYA